VSRGRKVLLGVGVVVLLAVGGVVWYLGPIAPIATGYAAKIVCSGHFVSGRPVERVQADLPDNPLVPYLRWSTDDSAGTVRVTLLGAWGSTAWYAPGYGCTLAEERPAWAGGGAPEREPSPEPWPAGDGPPEVADDVDTQALEAAIDPAFAEDDPEGRRRGTRAVVVVHRGRLVAERYAEGFDADTPLLGWSMTKSVASAMVGRLVQEGRLDVEAAGLRPEWDDERAAITLDELLHMASGLAFEEVYDPGTDATQMLFTPGDTGAFAADKPLEHDPGTVWSYSSGTTNIVCDVAQDAAGAGPDLARELVFDPLGMGSAVLEPDSSGGLVCSSFMYATARDWARFGQWFLQDGEWEGERLLPEGWVTYSTEPFEGAADTGYGAQWWLNEAPDGSLRMPSVPPDAYWASGNEGQQVVVIPSAELVVVRLGLSSFEGIAWGLEPLLRGVLDAVGAAPVAVGTPPG
jgi:CubicO group peptidase (beta-lactamase class C family)